MFPIFHFMLRFELEQNMVISVFWTGTVCPVWRIRLPLLTTVYQVCLPCLPKEEFQIGTKLTFVKYPLQASIFLGTFTIMDQDTDRIVR